MNGSCILLRMRYALSIGRMSQLGRNEMNATKRFAVMPYQVWVNAATGAQLSSFSAQPATGEWNLITRGWTLRDNDLGTTGCGRPPVATESEAKLLCDQFNSRHETVMAQRAARLASLRAAP